MKSKDVKEPGRLKRWVWFWILGYMFYFLAVIGLKASGMEFAYIEKNFDLWYFLSVFHALPYGLSWILSSVMSLYGGQVFFIMLLFFGLIETFIHIIYGRWMLRRFGTIKLKIFIAVKCLIGIAGIFWAHYAIDALFADFGSMFDWGGLFPFF